MGGADCIGAFGADSDFCVVNLIFDFCKISISTI